jgi:hypothetical protein
MYPEVFDELNKLRSELNEKRLTVPGTGLRKPLYHYTDTAGLLGILRSGNVWATHSKYLNDASEFQFAVGLLQEVVLEAAADAEADSWKDLCRDAVFDSEFSDSAGSAPLDDDTQFFVACFSEEKDRLSQWRGYGKSIGGYALGFPFDHLCAMEKQINNSQAGKTIDSANPQITVGFGRCWYKKKAQKSWLREAFDRVLRRLKEGGAPDTSYERDPIKRLGKPDRWLPGVLKAIALMVSPYFKDQAFEEEREWRFVVRVWRPIRHSRVGNRNRTKNDLRLDKVATVHFRAGEYSLIPYIELPLVLDDALSLPEVVVGPTPLPQNALEAAKRLLRREPKDARTPLSEPADRKIFCEKENDKENEKVVSSKIPFRRV